MTDTLLLDTDVVSLLFKGSPDGDRFKEIVTGKIVAVSFITVAELHCWALHKNWGEARILRQKSYLKQFVVLPYDSDIVLKWGEIKAALLKRGRPVNDNDVWIAASALRYGMPVVTNNVKHFEPIEALCGLTLLRPISRRS